MGETLYALTGQTKDKLGELITRLNEGGIKEFTPTTGHSGQPAALLKITGSEEDFYTGVVRYYLYTSSAETPEDSEEEVWVKNYGEGEFTTDQLVIGVQVGVLDDVPVWAAIGVNNDTITLNVLTDLCITYDELPEPNNGVATIVDGGEWS